MCQLYIIKLDSCKDFSQYQQYMSLVSSNKRSRICNFINDADKKLSLFSDLLVRMLICQTHDVKNIDLIFKENSYGKPYVVGLPNVHYNISHTKHAVAVGISDKPIGVDLEKITLADLTIAKRFFCKNEIAYITSQEAEIDKRFYEVWTKKEAYIKWDGQGLSLGLGSFDVIDEKIDKILYTIEVNDYIITVCSENNLKKCEVVQFQEKQFCQILQSLLCKE